MLCFSSYDEYFCHELNLFLFIKDKEFFNKIAKPLIASKLKKDMMDYFFLNDTENLKQYTQQHLFNKLNPLEKILLVFALKDVTDLKQNTLNYFNKKQEMFKISAQNMDKLLSLFLFLLLSLHPIYTLSVFLQISNSIGREAIALKASRGSTVRSIIAKFIGTDK